MKIQSLLLLVIWVSVAGGCATGTPTAIEPKSDVWEKVLASLPQDTKERLTRREMVGFDIRTADLPPPKSRQSQRNLDDLIALNWDAIATDWERRFVEAPEKRVRVQHVVLEVKMLKDTGWERPAVWLTITWLDLSSAPHTETFYGVGITYKGTGVASENPEAIFSLRVAFYSALVKAGAACAR